MYKGNYQNIAVLKKSKLKCTVQNNILCSKSCKPTGRAVLLTVRETASVTTKKSFPLLSIRGIISFQMSMSLLF